jgi:hypothetical protein
MAGTGKSFIGALLAKALHKFSDQIILVVCYTNHALDQFLEDLLKIGISSSSIVRLGGKSTPATARLSLYDQVKNSGSKRSDDDWLDIHKNDYVAKSTSTILRRSITTYPPINSRPSFKSICAFLKFHEDKRFFQAFLVPRSTSGAQIVGPGGRPIGSDYLIRQWVQGKDAGVLRTSPHVQNYQDVWDIRPQQRSHLIKQWYESIFQDEANALAQSIVRHGEAIDAKDEVFSRPNATMMRSKRVIACTTTAAAKYYADLRATAPGVLITEEAGEILESHIITAIAGSVKQLILIGDHLQLRPKISNYGLTVEKGEGYDLNRSLFERLIRHGYPHKTLHQQHRMRPEISRLVREMTYPNLTDAPRTAGRPDIRGLQQNVLFIEHGHVEDIIDQNSKDQSRMNTKEAELVIHIVQYLEHQSYGADSIVILTPYLGQLNTLRRLLSESHDAVLNDLDTKDLIAAGFNNNPSMSRDKKQIRLATIGNVPCTSSTVVLAS